MTAKNLLTKLNLFFLALAIGISLVVYFFAEPIEKSRYNSQLDTIHTSLDIIFSSNNDILNDILASNRLEILPQILQSIQKTNPKIIAACLFRAEPKFQLCFPQSTTENEQIHLASAEEGLSSFFGTILH